MKRRRSPGVPFFVSWQSSQLIPIIYKVVGLIFPYNGFNMSLSFPAMIGTVAGKIKELFET
jgi:hypothetical protein